MSQSNTTSASNTDFLHPDKNTQTYTSRKTNNIRLWWPTEKLSCFVDKILQSIAQQQKSYLKDTTNFINFIKETKLLKGVILVSMNITSLYTNIPQEEGINI